MATLSSCKKELERGTGVGAPRGYTSLSGLRQGCCLQTWPQAQWSPPFSARRHPCPGPRWPPHRMHGTLPGSIPATNNPLSTTAKRCLPMTWADDAHGPCLQIPHPSLRTPLHTALGPSGPETPAHWPLPPALPPGVLLPRPAQSHNPCHMGKPGWGKSALLHLSLSPP